MRREKANLRKVGNRQGDGIHVIERQRKDNLAPEGKGTTGRAIGMEENQWEQCIMKHV